MNQGKIIKGIAGFYYVHVDSLGVYECKAKGIFRKQDIKPLVGDNVIIEVLDEDNRIGNITEILPRTSELIRPAAANVDQALVIFAITNPEPNFNLLDRFLVMMDYQSLPTVILFNKEDLADDSEKERVKNIYRDCGCTLLFASAAKEQGLFEVREILMGKTTILAGPSGVGKSSLTNYLMQESTMETGDVSRIGRGRHTTRVVTLYELFDGKVMDTPGFSALDFNGYSREDIRDSFREFHNYTCTFKDCINIT